MAEAGEGDERGWWSGGHGLVKVNSQGGMIMTAYFLVRQGGNLEKKTLN